VRERRIRRSNDGGGPSGQIRRKRRIERGGGVERDLIRSEREKRRRKRRRKRRKMGIKTHTSTEDLFVLFLKTTEQNTKTNTGQTSGRGTKTRGNKTNGVS